MASNRTPKPTAPSNGAAGAGSPTVEDINTPFDSVAESVSGMRSPDLACAFPWFKIMAVLGHVS